MKLRDLYSINGLEKAERYGKLTFEIYETLPEALVGMNAFGGILYTQVDGDNGKPYYDRGNRLVNRTGIYAVVKETQEVEKNGK